MDQLIAETEHGVLVTMLNYVRSYLDPLTVLATGITRNGTFLIENGRLPKLSIIPDSFKVLSRRSRTPQTSVLS